MLDEWRQIIDPVQTIFVKYWRSWRGMLLLLLVIVIASSAASIGAPYVFSRLVDRLTTDRWAETLFYGFVLYAALLGIATVLQRAASYLAFMSAESLDFITETSFFNRLVRKSVDFFIEHNAAEVRTAQMQGSQSLATVAHLVLISFVPGFVQITLTLAVMGAAINPAVMAIVTAYGAVFISLTYFINRWTRTHRDAAVEANQENAKFSGNAIVAMETLRYFGSDRWMSDRFAESSRRAFESWRRFCMVHIGFSGIYGVALAMQFALTFALLLPRYREGLLTVGDIVLFSALLMQLNRPFEMIGQAIDSLARAYSRFQPFARMWSAPEEQGAGSAIGFEPTAGRLTFDNVSFAYQNGRGIQRVAFIAERGRVTFIVGETGSGKSTIFKLLLKSLEPKTGEIRVDGMDLARIERADWYPMIGVVPQEVMLLNDTLRSNIVLGREMDDTRLRDAAEKAAILERIEEMPDGFNSMIGERGLKLSGGERQRIAIARALYAEPKILLLDEASSALDEATEREIMDHVRQIADEVTVIAITHRRGTIRPDDQIVDLDRGRGQSLRGQTPPATVKSGQ
jgi:ATP-binding cassette subfamily B protein